MSLYELFSGIKDPRRKKGMRTTLPQMFCMIVISNLCGYFGGRPISKFSKLHSKTFTEELGLKHRVPSHVSFSHILNVTDSGSLVGEFNEWATGYVPLDKGAPVSGDGKALGSTVINQHGKGQDFQAVVSIFCQETGLVRAIEEYRNKKGNEIDVVRFLINQLNGMGLTFHLDALHAQKKL